MMFVGVLFCKDFLYSVKNQGGRRWVHLTLTSHHSRRLIDFPFPDKISLQCVLLSGCVFMSVGRSSLFAFFSIEKE
jgi:hypothetical protein